MNFVPLVMVSELMHVTTVKPEKKSLKLYWVAKMPFTIPTYSNNKVLGLCEMHVR